MADRGSIAAAALEACLKGDASNLADWFTDDVVGWSPNMFVQNLDELVEIISYRDGALSELDLVISSLDVFGNKGFVEYRVAAKFTGPFVIDDDVVIEPNGNEIVLGACMVLEFVGDKISAFRNYFDDATFLEQMLG